VVAPEKVTSKKVQAQIEVQSCCDQMAPRSSGPVTPKTSRTLVGIAVSPEQVEGRARVMVELDSVDLEDDEILVCNTTDPSWAPLFVLAGAVVIDIGGTMSYGAIVAREMGIPCVINTRVGTAVIKTGDRILVDGTTGTVQLIDGGSGTDARQDRSGWRSSEH
jgi:phosphoenolpyruvate synthase/pyruvate phosphate dikinase